MSSWNAPSGHQFVDDGMCSSSIQYRSESIVASKPGCKPRIFVTNDVLRNAMQLDNGVEEYAGNVHCCTCSCCCRIMNHLAELVNKHNDGVVATSCARQA